jgi:hypothetical protein
LAGRRGQPRQEEMIMTQDKARKTAIRRRMAETGEPYSVARNVIGTAIGAGPVAAEEAAEDPNFLEITAEEDYASRYAREAEEAGMPPAELQARVAAVQAQERADRAQDAADRGLDRADRAVEAAVQAEDRADQAGEEAEPAVEWASEAEQERAEERAGRMQDAAERARELADVAEADADEAQDRADEARELADEARELVDEAREPRRLAPAAACTMHPWSASTGTR